MNLLVACENWWDFYVASVTIISQRDFNMSIKNNSSEGNSFRPATINVEAGVSKSFEENMNS
jgi:hypothetical protein